MSQTIIECFFEAAKNGPESVLPLCDEAIEIIAVREDKDPAQPLFGTFHGHAGVLEFFAGLREAFQPQAFVIEDALQNENLAYASGWFRHRVARTGKLFESHWALRCHLHEGRIKTYRFYEDTGKLAESWAAEAAA